MSYFNYFPSTLYRLNTPEQVAVKNILLRAKIKDYLVEKESAFLDYRIRDGETPESLAYRVYGKAEYHWIILLFNEIHDIYNQWPMSNNELDSMMQKEYGDKGKVLHVDVSMMKVRNKTGAYVGFDRRNPHFEIGTVIEQVTFEPPWNSGPWQAGVNPIPEPTEVIAKGVVKEWDPNLYKLVIEPTSGIFRYTGVRDQTTDPSVLDRRELSPDMRFTNSRGQVVYAPLTRIVQDNRYGIHHFENDNGDILSPTLPIAVPLDVPDSPNSFAAIDSRLIESYAIGNAEVFDTLAYGRVSVVNNYQHESAVNESKRVIKMMRPKYIDSIIKDMRILMGR